jgi:NAD(P)-dependent dehydrogenase (short-subunit alcohol dehydrogenase family)
MLLDGKIAIVTGAGRGMGAAFAVTLSRNGAAVALADIDIDAVDATAAELEVAGADPMAIGVDVADEDSVADMVEAVARRLGPPDILVNNAALMFADVEVATKPFWEVTVDEWDRTLDINARGTWLCARAVFPYFRDKKSGKIVNIASDMAFGTDLRFPARLAAYTASKAAVVGLTRALAGEAGPFGVNVNAVAPGIIATETILSRLDPASVQSYGGSAALGRVGTADDVAQVVLFLASSLSDHVSGQVLVVDGGGTAH